MSLFTAHAIAHPNIALIKYWGNKNQSLRIPVNDSISFNLAGLSSSTEVVFNNEYSEDQLILNGRLSTPSEFLRMSLFLDVIRKEYGQNIFAHVNSRNDFPTSAGIASSASAFSALALAATSALGMNISQKDLSRLARRGSGSACRSIPDGFVLWQAGSSDQESYAYSIAPADYWAITDCVAVVQTRSKEVGSSEGQERAASSPLQNARINDAHRRIDLCKKAVLDRDFEKLAFIVEQDCNMMHAVMCSSTPPLFYWSPISLEIILNVLEWRKNGLPVCYTLDAGPNVHVITPDEYAPVVIEKLRLIPEVQSVLIGRPGPGAHLAQPK